MDAVVAVALLPRHLLDAAHRRGCSGTAVAAARRAAAAARRAAVGARRPRAAAAAAAREQRRAAAVGAGRERPLVAVGAGAERRRRCARTMRRGDGAAARLRRPPRELDGGAASCAAILARSSGSGGGGRRPARARTRLVEVAATPRSRVGARASPARAAAHRGRRRWNALRDRRLAANSRRRLGRPPKVVVGRARPQQHLELAVAPPHAEVADLVLAQRVESASERSSLLIARSGRCAGDRLLRPRARVAETGDRLHRVGAARRGRGGRRGAGEFCGRRRRRAA